MRQLEEGEGGDHWNGGASTRCASRAPQRKLGTAQEAERERDRHTHSRPQTHKHRHRHRDTETHAQTHAQQHTLVHTQRRGAVHQNAPPVRLGPPTARSSQGRVTASAVPTTRPAGPTPPEQPLTSYTAALSTSTIPSPNATMETSGLAHSTKRRPLRALSAQPAIWSSAGVGRWVRRSARCRFGDARRGDALGQEERSRSMPAGCGPARCVVDHSSAHAGARRRWWWWWWGARWFLEGRRVESHTVSRTEQRTPRSLPLPA